MASRRNDEDEDEVEVAIIRGPGAKKFLAQLSGNDDSDDDEDEDEPKKPAKKRSYFER